MNPMSEIRGYRVHRRSLLAAALAAAPAPLAGSELQWVHATGDGIPLTAEEYAALLTRLLKSGKTALDSYSRGGCVEALEARMAELLGKEAAIWMPTGTLANHLAVRTLAGTRRRVLVQAESHLYNDSGDCAQSLSGLHLVPLAPGKATFTVDDAERAMSASTGGRVNTPIGAIQIESPVRRRLGEKFDFAQLDRICAWARQRGIGLHLDGARIFLESAYSGRPVKEYAFRFDTVYVSLYKYFNAASGAILAGPKALLDGMVDTRRMFGGGLNRVWPFAAVALHFLEGFEDRFHSAVKASEKVIDTLAKDGNFEIERVPNGTNIFHLRTTGVNAPIYQQRLESAGVSARVPPGSRFTMQVNETWLRVPPEEITARFRRALG